MLKKLKFIFLHNFEQYQHSNLRSCTITQTRKTMLEYTKTILQKVSFSRDLFSKELKKSFRWLKKEELLILQSWCIITFGHIYGDVINVVFNPINS